MLKRQAFKFELRPNKQQACQMRRFAGACRYVYNRALALQKLNYETGNKHIPYNDMASWLVDWKNDVETHWLKEPVAQLLQQSLKDLERAYKNFFAKRAGFPKFKKKGIKESFRYPQRVKLEPHNKRIYLPKLGWMKLRLSREVFGTIKNTTVSYKAGKWFVAIQTECEVQQPVHPQTSSVGIDVGIKRLATLSDGRFFKPINSFKCNRKKLAKLQRKLSKQVKGSRNREKTKLKIQKLYARIANIRKDVLHKTTTTICKNHATVVIEKLKIVNMSKSAKGTVGHPGKNVKAKSGLNRAILDQGWGMLFTQLKYKQQWLGGQVLLANPAYTSQTCAVCGNADKENRKKQAMFTCTWCGHSANADVNAALNILALGKESNLALYTS